MLSKSELLPYEKENDSEYLLLWLWPFVYKIFFLGKFYCFIMKRKNAPMPILETELTETLANDHFDDWHGAALNLPKCNRAKKEEKALCLAVVFDELFGGGSLLWWFEVEADFLQTFFVNILTVIVCWHLCLPFNKYVTPARLALSHREKKML